MRGSAQLSLQDAKNSSAIQFTIKNSVLDLAGVTGALKVSAQTIGKLFQLRVIDRLELLCHRGVVAPVRTALGKQDWNKKTGAAVFVVWRRSISRPPSR